MQNRRVAWNLEPKRARQCVFLIHFWWDIISRRRIGIRVKRLAYISSRRPWKAETFAQFLLSSRYAVGIIQEFEKKKEGGWSRCRWLSLTTAPPTSFPALSYSILWTKKMPRPFFFWCRKWDEKKVVAYEKWSAWQQGSPFFLFDSFIPCYTTKIARRYYVYPARYINGCRISHITSQRFFFSKGKRSTYVFEFDNRKPFEKKNTEGNVCKRICCQQSAAWQKHLKSFSFHFLIFFWMEYISW